MDILSYKMGQNSVQPDKPDQDKTANPSTQTQVIRPDAGYELASVTINAVTSDIDSNIQPENIAKDVEILGVTGTLSSGAEPNIFVQEIEPESKDGLWIEADMTYEDVIVDENVRTSGEWEGSNDVPAFPGTYTYSVGTQSGNYYYLWTQGASSGSQPGYKYDFANNTWSTIQNKTYYDTQGGVSNTDKYVVFGTVGNPNPYMYIYDIDNNQIYSKDLSNATYKTTLYSSQIMKDKVVYVFGNGSNNRYSFKIDYTNDITNPTFSQIASTPDNMKIYGESILVGDDVYIFGVASSSGGTSSSNRILKYNITNNSFTLLTTTLPAGNFSSYTYKRSPLLKINNYIYFPPHSNRKAIYRFDLINETFEEYVGMPEGVNYYYNCGFAYYNNKIYLIGYSEHDGTSGTAYRTSKTLLMESTYENDSVVISQGDDLTTDYYTKLYSDNELKIPVEDAYLYNDGTLYTNLPTYIGDGTDWNKIKG